MSISSFTVFPGIAKEFAYFCLNKKRIYGKQKRITLDEFTIREMRPFLKATGELEEFSRDIGRMPLFLLEFRNDGRVGRVFFMENNFYSERIFRMLIEDFNKTIDIWSRELETYDSKQLFMQPDAANWSLAQVVIHLINENRFYIKQIESCLSCNENQKEKMKEEAEIMFLKNEFPNERIKGSEPGQKISLPVTKLNLEQGLLKLKTKMNEIWIRINNSTSEGKAMHPGLGYFNAKEWFQFAEMHLRHHLRQKKRIDEFLQTNHRN